MAKDLWLAIGLILSFGAPADQTRLTGHLRDWLAYVEQGSEPLSAKQVAFWLSGMTQTPTRWERQVDAIPNITHVYRRFDWDAIIRECEAYLFKENVSSPVDSVSLPLVLARAYQQRARRHYANGHYRAAHIDIRRAIQTDLAGPYRVDRAIMEETYDKLSKRLKSSVLMRTDPHPPSKLPITTTAESIMRDCERGALTPSACISLLLCCAEHYQPEVLLDAVLPTYRAELTKAIRAFGIGEKQRVTTETGYDPPSEESILELRAALDARGNY